MRGGLLPEAPGFGGARRRRSEPSGWRRPADSDTRAKNWTTFNYEAEEKKSCSAMVLDDVSNALLCRRLCAHVPLHRLRVAFDDCHWWNEHHVNQWLSYVLRHSSQELHLDLRF
ncbi:hypothetical protein ZWY2020_046253 [Hordeum vulgare]|nr:hypothetical protein ZWY2020_046253 [Hordeum vulgare]